MNLTINKLNYSTFYGKRTIKQPDDWNNMRQVVVRGIEQEEDGI